ncbi:unnamed protein product [Calypogeia fissa]
MTDLADAATVTHLTASKYGKRCCAGLPHWSSQNPIGGKVKVPCESIDFRAQAEALRLRAQLMKGLDISTFNPHGSS